MKFLFTLQPSNDLGLLSQSLPIARQLRDRGHEVVFCTSGKAPIKVLRDAGFMNYVPGNPLYLIFTGDLRFIIFLKLIASRYGIKYLKILSWYLKHIRKSATSEIWDIDHYMYLMGMGNKKYSHSVVKSMDKVLLRHKPDAIVNYWNPYAVIAARTQRVPVVSVIQSDIHPDNKGFIWWKEKPDDIPSSLPAINSVLLDNNLAEIQSVGELFLGDLTLVLGTPEVDPIPDTKNITHIGSLLLQDNTEILPAWVNELSNDTPIIWIYPGNMHYVKGGDSPFDGIAIAQACIKALKDMNVQVVLTSGGHELPEEILSLPSNFRYAEFLPGLAMAMKCDLMIHHGGYGSCQTGIYAGTPAVIIPTFSERESNARRIDSLEVCEIVLPESDLSGKNKTVNFLELREKVKLVLSDKTYKANAINISKSLKERGGPAVAASMIENFMSSDAVNNLYV